MAIIRAQAVLKHVSGLARHNAVNTFHFTGVNNGVTLLDIANRVSDFYVTDLPDTGGGIEPALKYMLSPAYRTLDVHLYEVPGTLTDGRETPSGPPILTVLGSTDNLYSGNTTPLPAEVACCISYQGTPGAGVVQARRRGRIYIGPLNNGTSTKVSDVARPSASFRSTLQKCMLRLIQQVDDNAEFVVYSRPYAGRAAIPRADRPDLPALPARPATTVNVDQIWIDDEFDTQRRRGGERTGRTLVSTGEV